MKKLFFTIAMSAFLITTAIADKIISPEKLPLEAKDFIETNFKGVAATYTEKDFDGYEVKLSDGTEIDFRNNGEWESVEAHITPLPVSILPKAVATTVAKTYPQASIMKVEKERSEYEITLNNMMKLYIDKKGILKGQKIDD